MPVDGDESGSPCSPDCELDAAALDSDTGLDAVPGSSPGSTADVLTAAFGLEDEALATLTSTRVIWGTDTCVLESVGVAGLDVEAEGGLTAAVLDRPGEIVAWSGIEGVGVSLLPTSSACAQLVVFTEGSVQQVGIILDCAAVLGVEAMGDYAPDLTGALLEGL